MKLHYLSLVLCVLFTVSCDQERKVIAVIQQYSKIQLEWQDVAVVYGFAYDNLKLAEITKEGYSKAYPEMIYRVVRREIKGRKYVDLTKKIKSP